MYKKLFMITKNDIHGVVKLHWVSRQHDLHWLERFILSSMKRCLVIGDSQPFPYANNSSLGCLHGQNTYGGSSPVQNPNLWPLTSLNFTR